MAPLSAPLLAPLLAPTFVRRREETRHRRARVALRNSRLPRKGCSRWRGGLRRVQGQERGHGPGRGRGGSDPPNFAEP
jgi:hypothetical protein